MAQFIYQALLAIKYLYTKHAVLSCVSYQTSTFMFNLYKVKVLIDLLPLDLNNLGKSIQLQRYLSTFNFYQWSKKEANLLASQKV